MITKWGTLWTISLESDVLKVIEELEIYLPQGLCDYRLGQQNKILKIHLKDVTIRGISEDNGIWTGKLTAFLILHYSNIFIVLDCIV